jgi:hypothetical protein
VQQQLPEVVAVVEPREPALTQPLIQRVERTERQVLFARGGLGRGRSLFWQAWDEIDVWIGARLALTIRTD